LPSEEVTPPVTKTYFAMGRDPPGFFRCYRITGDRASEAGRGHERSERWTSARWS
jgi:hypothetical protein